MDWEQDVNPDQLETQTNIYIAVLFFLVKLESRILSIGRGN